MTTHTRLPCAIRLALATSVSALSLSARGEEPKLSWTAPDRATKVAALIPGRKIPMPPPEEFMAEWTLQQVAKWEKDHKPLPPEQAYAAYAKADPPDEQLTALIPDHISPFGRAIGGKADPEKAAEVMVYYCPFCGHWGQTLGAIALVDTANPFHVKMPCCGQDLYEREQDFPANYNLRPNGTAQFRHLDDTVKEVPAYTFTDKDGVAWQIFPGTVVAYHRWLGLGDQAVGFMRKFQETADPVWVHKLAALLDRVADVYYGLPLSFHNELAMGKDGQPLSRAEWEAAPRPVRYGSAFGEAGANCFAWNRRSPLFNRGWVFMSRECIWVEPFARVRHHPAFKAYSQQKYGDLEALDRKIMSKLIRELALIFKSFGLQSDYQDGAYTDLMMVGILMRDLYLFDFAAGHQECVLYNHHYHDGMNGEGAPNYMAMLNGYYGYMTDPKGWLEFAPEFLKDHPFFAPASQELHKLHTVRGVPLEFGDQYEYVFDSRFITDSEKVRENERLTSMNWPGYGIGLLRVGGPGHRQEIFMTYDRVSLHGASDKLGIECWVDGVPVMREGGYAAHFNAAYLDKSRPEIQAFLAMPYPREIFEVARRTEEFDTWDWAHSCLAHNTVSVNETGTGPGWGDNEGFGELITYKGGEPRGAPGARFQVLDARDRFSFERMGVKVDEFRRTLLGVEAPDGRPYLVDVLRLQGGQRHALYQSAWADPAEERLPPVAASAPDMAAYLDKTRNALPDSLPTRRSYRQIRNVQLLKPPADQWGLEWKTDYAAYAPFPPSGKERIRPLPQDVGRVRLRLIGLKQEGATTLLRGKGPWVAFINQPLPNGQSVTRNVGFRDAWDFLIESRTAEGSPQPKGLNSIYLHVLEGFREGEKSAIKEVTRLTLAGTTRGSEDVVGLKLALTDGHIDTVVFQPTPSKVRFQDGLETDAQYALVRRDAKGEMSEVDMVRATELRCGKFSAHVTGDCRGTIVDLVGDLTGTHLESAFIIRPESPWPLGAALAGRPISVETVNQHTEAYTIEKVMQLPDGLLRVDLANHAPLSWGWYQVNFLDPQKPNVLCSSRQLWAGINTPWWRGSRAWFPERGQTFTIAHTGSDRVTMRVAEEVDLKTKGIRPGDWFVIYGIEPRLKVSVPGEMVWKRVTSDDSPRSLGERRVTGTERKAAGALAKPVTYVLRTTGDATITMPASTGSLWCRIGTGKWQKAKATFNSAQRTTTVTFPGNDAAGQTVWLVSNKPEWLQLEDSGPPEIRRVLLDGKPLDTNASLNLGLISPPSKLALEAEDRDNPIDPRSIAVSLDGRRIDADNNLVKVQLDPEDRKSVVIEVDIGKALAAEPMDLPARHIVAVSLDDFAIDQDATSFSLTYSKRIKVSGDALFLSDLKEVSSFVHGSFRKDTDYYGKPLQMRGVVHAKCLQTHVETAAMGNYSEVIYDVPQTPVRKKLCALIGVSDDSGGDGSVVFQVQVAKEGGEWETQYTSPVLHGGQEAVGISVNITGATKLRLYCTDAGDGIGGDHATWAEARLE